ncbi:ATP-binding protein, partial [Pseudomonadota bacterium]
MSKITAKKDLILDEQVRLLFAAIPLSAILTVVNASILTFIQWNVLNHTHLLTWLIGLLLVVVFRTYLASQYKQSESTLENTSRWQYLFNTGTILAALFWCGASLFLFPQQSITHQVFLAFVIGGMCAGAVTTLSFLRLPIACFLCLSLLPLIWNFLTSDTDISIAMGIMILLFFIGTLSSAKSAYESTLSNITMRLDADLREKALHESEARYKHIFEAAPLGIIHYDQNGSILKCNMRMGEMLGCESLKLIGKKMFDTVGDDMLIHAVKRSLAGKNGFYQGSAKQLYPGEDTPIRAYCRGIVQLNGDVVGGVAVVEDMTEDQRVERLKSEFVSTVSHELRTPLTAILGSLSLLKSGAVTDQSDIQELLTNAHRNSERLLMLINDILDIEKISAGKIEYNKAPLLVMDFVEQAIQVNAAYGDKHHVQYEITQSVVDDLAMFGDHHRLMQVMSNLLSNATKFSPENSNVQIILKHDDKNITIAVCDQGVGIPEEFRDKIFERFSQADSSDIRLVGGTGLGLNISRAIINQ